MKNKTKKAMKHKCAYSLLILLGIICTIYGIFLYFTGFGGNLSFVWLIPAFFCFFSCGILSKKIVLRKWMKYVMLYVFLPIFCIFLITECIIFSGFFEKPSAEPEYIIVLGTTVYKSGPCYLLRQRLQKAADLSKEYEEAIIVVTGGQGKTEPFPEGTEMKRYLVESLGIPEEKIYVEKESMNTFENLTLTGEILEEEFENFSYEKSSVLVVTNNFHMYRAKQIAKKAGYQNISGAPAETLVYLFPHYMVREFFSIAKNLVLGRM